MIPTKQELKIIDLFRKNLLIELSIEEIMTKIQKKSYTWTYNAIIKLKNVLNIKKIGKIQQISLNINNPETISLLEYLDKTEALKNKIPIINDIIESISIKKVYFTLLVTGSYATGNNRKESDLDLVIIVDKEENKKEIIPYITEITRLEEREVDLHMFTKEEFLIMLTNNEENFGKECFRKHLLFYGIDAYYQIIKEAIKNGLQFKI